MSKKSLLNPFLAQSEGRMSIKEFLYASEADLSGKGTLSKHIQKDVDDSRM